MPFHTRIRLQRRTGLSPFHTKIRYAVYWAEGFGWRLHKDYRDKLEDISRHGGVA